MGRYFEDWQVGDIVRTEGITITESHIIEFALKYDPQPFHIDVEAARQSQFGGLISSGFLTQALTFRLFRDTGVITGTGMGAGGIDELRWPKPVRPGDTLRAVVEVVAKRPSSRPDRGYVRFRYTTFNQHGEPVFSMESNGIVATRDGATLEV